MGTLSQRGAIEPSKWVVIFWGAATGAVAAVMLVIGQDKALEGIQNLTFIGALPFAIVMIFMCVAMLKDLRSDDITVRDQKGAEVLEQAVIAGTEEHDGEFQLVTTPAESSDEESESAEAGKKE
jgi:choline-glycine betaine transporter